MGNFGISPVITQSGGTNEVQTITITGGPTGGTWTATFDAQTTAAIPYNESAANVQTALIALSTIPAAGVSVARSGAGSAGDPYVYTVTFIGGLAAENVSLMTASGASLTGGSSPDAVVALVTAGVAPVIEEHEIGNTDQVAVMLIPSSDAAGSVIIYESIDGGTQYADVHTEVLAAGTNVLVHIIDLPASHLKVDTSGLTAGSCDVQIARTTRS